MQSDSDKTPQPHSRCPDCKMCQVCSESRCRMCRAGCKNNGAAKLSFEEQIALYNALNPGLTSSR